jgi:uncharacterized protein (TIGR04562 family)
MNINPWRSTSISTALEGRSFIDTKRIHIHSAEEAEEYLTCYGFDINDEMDAIELENIRVEAILLIQEELLHKDEHIPQALVDEKDVRQYLLYASGHGPKELTPWSGAILRVLHTLTHSYSYLNDIYYDDIREQIFSRFQKHIVRHDQETFFGNIKLVDVEFRDAKTKRSVAMKLLHKAENVAADIFDWIGIRFVTHTRSDVIDILAYLREKHVITYANLKPSRSRNTLIDIDWINQSLSNGKPIKNIKAELELMDYPASQAGERHNKFSELSYHSVQITYRQRIKITQQDGKKLCFYFPFEIQLMDNNSFIKTRGGMASHDEYKNRQKTAVRKRVLPFL